MYSCNKFCTIFNSDENYVSYELLTEAVLQVVNKLSSKYKTGTIEYCYLWYSNEKCMHFNQLLFFITH